MIPYVYFGNYISIIASCIIINYIKQAFKEFTFHGEDEKWPNIDRSIEIETDRDLMLYLYFK